MKSARWRQLKPGHREQGGLQEYGQQKEWEGGTQGDGGGGERRAAAKRGAGSGFVPRQGCQPQAASTILPFHQGKAQTAASQGWPSDG